MSRAGEMLGLVCGGAGGDAYDWRWGERVGMMGVSCVEDQADRLPAKGPIMMQVAKATGGSTWTMRTTIKRYAGQKCQQAWNVAWPADAGRVDGVVEGSVETDGALWQCRVKRQAIAADGAEWCVTFRLMRGAMTSAGVEVAFEIDGWSEENYVMMPAAVVAGNRFTCLPMQYPPLMRERLQMGVNLPTTITDVPRLRFKGERSRIEQTTGDPSTPAMGVFFPSAKRATWILTEQQTRFGNSGLTIEESDDRTHATFAITAPCVREEHQWMCGRAASDDVAADWKVGDEVTLRVRMHVIDAPKVQSLFDRFAAIRKSMTGEPSLPNMLPFSRAWELIEEKYNRENWREMNGYDFYGVGVGTNPEEMTHYWQLGWVGGGMSSLPMLAAGNTLSQSRAMRTLEMMLTKTQRPSGFLYGIGNGLKWYGDGFNTPHPHNMLMTRKVADALYFIGKHVLLLKSRDAKWAMPAAWEQAYRRLADAFVKLWRTYGQFGQFVDVETGELLVGTTTSAGMASAGLALAAKVLCEPTYMEVAEASAKFYYERDVQRGVTNAGPGEILQCPDSESAFGVLESFVVLHELTGKREWLVAAEEMSRQCATWCVSYDYVFPTTSLFGRLDMRTTGSVIANVQNKHAAPGICTMSGDAFLRLFRATGDVFHLELLREIAHNLPQYISRDDRPIATQHSGWINERVNLSDWEGKNNVGNIFDGSCWPEVSMMLTWTEVPGVYVQADTGVVCAIDHVSATLVKTTATSVVLRISNATAFDAKVRVFVETSESAKRAMGFVGVDRWPVVAVSAGQASEVELAIDRG